MCLHTMIHLGVLRKITKNLSQDTRFEVRKSLEFKSERLSFEQTFSLSQNKLPHTTGTNVITVRLYYKNVKILKFSFPAPSHGAFV
jgi:hypothetical protein